MPARMKGLPLMLVRVVSILQPNAHLASGGKNQPVTPGVTGCPRGDRLPPGRSVAPGETDYPWGDRLVGPLGLAQCQQVKLNAR